MLNTATAYSTTLTGPFTSESNTIDALDSQSKLREILRDQSRREEQQHYSAVSSPGGYSSTITTQRHDSFKRKSAASPSLAAGGITSSISGGYFVGSSAMRAGSPSGRREAIMSHSITTGGLDNYTGSSASLTSHLHRERSSRQAHTDQLGTDPDITSINDKLARSHSTAGLTKGLDLKVVILGAQGVGKTSLVHRYTSGHFSASSVPSTIGASFLTKKLIVDDVKIRLQLWDTAGQERFRSMAPMYYRGSNAAVIVYDITNPSSFEDVKTWIDELRKNVPSDLVIHIVGSKVDLAPRSRRVDLEEARERIASWTNPLPPKASQMPATPNRSRSTFSALGRMGTSSLPTSPSSTSSIGNGRLGGFGALSALGSKPSRLGPLGRDAEEEGGGVGGEGDVNSSPSTGSSNGNGQNGEMSKAEEWDYIEVSEVSSKDNEGIEDVFLGIATRLVERKEEMDALLQSRQDRNSVFLTEPMGQETVQEGGASWCCST